MDWDRLDNDWKSASQQIKYEDLKAALMKKNGFNSPLEFASPLNDEVVRPTVIYAQICGQRKKLNQIDLSKMQKNNTDPSKSAHAVYRILGTYDTLSDGLDNLF